MSALMCPATLVVARHGEASYRDAVFSDEGGCLTGEGRAQSHALAERAAVLRIAHVWCSDAARAVQTGEIVAARLGVGVTTHRGLREVDVGALDGEPFSIATIREVTDRWFGGDLVAGFPDGESGADVVARYGGVLAEIADLHRGETVLVVTHQTATCIALPSLARNVSPTYAEHHQLDNGETAELVIDSDEWVLTRWRDRPLV